MKFESQPSSANSLKEQIESKRRASFKGYDALLKTITPGFLDDPRSVSQEVLKDVSYWAKTYRGYEDEDSFYETLTNLSEKLAKYAETADKNDVNAFAEGVYEMVDETFPSK